MARVWRFEKANEGPWDWDVVLLDGTRIGGIRKATQMNHDYWTTDQYVVSHFYRTRDEAASVLYRRRRSS